MIKTDWQIPSWAEGTFVTSGPSKYEMGDIKMSTLTDGFGRVSRIDIKDGKIDFKSKLMET